MFLRLRSKITYANVVATIAVFLALGGGALAATSFIGSDGKIHGCVGKHGALTVLKPGKQCGKGTTAISWNQKGPAGAPGAACLSSDPNCRGPKGDPCPSSDPNCRGNAGAPGSPAASMLTGGFQVAAGGPQYAAPVGISTPSSTESDVATLSPAVPVVGRDLSVQGDFGNTTPLNRSYTLRVNGTNTALTCSTSSGGNAACTDTTHAVTIPANSTISIVYDDDFPGGTSGIHAIRFGWRATTP